MSQIMGVGRYNRLFQKMLQIKGDAPLPELAPEAFANFTIGDDRIEWSYLADEKVESVGFDIAASAGNPSRFRFRNPANTNVIAVLEGFVLTVNAGTDLTLFRHSDVAADLATVIGGRSRDTRWEVNNTAMVPSIQNNGGNPSGGTAGVWQIAATSPLILFPPRGLLVVSPSRGFDLFTGNNVRFSGMIVYRERGMEAEV